MALPWRTYEKMWVQLKSSLQLTSQGALDGEQHHSWSWRPWTLKGIWVGQQQHLLPGKLGFHPREDEDGKTGAKSMEFTLAM